MQPYIDFPAMCGASAINNGLQRSPKLISFNPVIGRTKQKAIRQRDKYRMNRYDRSVAAERALIARLNRTNRVITAGMKAAQERKDNALAFPISLEDCV